MKYSYHLSRRFHRRRYYEDNRDRILGRKRRKRDKMTAEDLEAERRKHHQKRALALARLGGQCSDCGFSDLGALEIDHIDPSGYGIRKEQSTVAIHRVLTMADPASRYRLYCANCHALKTRRGNEYGRKNRKDAPAPTPPADPQLELFAPRLRIVRDEQDR